MKRTLLFLIAVLCFAPVIASAVGSGSSLLLNDSESFTVARSFKLGETTNSKNIGGGMGDKVVGGDCDPSNPDCSSLKACSTSADCDNGQHCSSAKICKDLCEKGKLMDGSSCTDPVYPTCSADGHTSYCACSVASTPGGDSCPAGKKCQKSGNRDICTNCTAGEQCTCPSGKKANGSGQCVTCQSNNDCAYNETCVNPNLASASCQRLTCATDSYVDSHTCKNCSSAISNCTVCASATECLSCGINYNLSADKRSCVSKTCATNEYLNTTDGQCYSCEAGCATCSNSSSCNSCIPGYVKVGNYCQIKTCEKGYYLNMQTGECAACPATCTECNTVMDSTLPTTCSACAEGYTLALGVCQSVSCAVGSYVNGNDCTVCSTVLSNCTACSSGTNCTACEPAYNVVNGRCVLKTCAAGSVLNTTTGNCDTCSANCGNCTGNTTTCTSCKPNYTLSGSSCNPTPCPSGSGTNQQCQVGTNRVVKGYSGPNACYGCDVVPCAGGYSTATTSCSGSAYLTTSGYSGGQACGKCNTCSANCSSCNASGCTSCSGDYKLSGSSCVLKTCAEINSSYQTSCAAGYSAVSTGKTGSNGACVTCSTIAGWCANDSACGASNKKCVNNSCVLKSCGEMGYIGPSQGCSVGYTKTSVSVSGSDGQCYSCPVAACPSGYSTATTSCPAGYTLTANGQSGSTPCRACVAGSCPSGYSTATTSCSAGKKLITSGQSGSTPCRACTNCSNGESCNCPSGQVANGSGGCVSTSCPSGEQTSTSCPISVHYAQSTGNTANGQPCYKCQCNTYNGWYIGSNCSAGWYASTVADCTKCSPCSGTCATCSGSSTNCTSCPAGKKLSNGTCIDAVSCTYSSSSACTSGISNCSSCGSNTDKCYSCSTCKSGYSIGSNGYACFKDSSTPSCPSGTSYITGSYHCNWSPDTYTGCIPYDFGKPCTSGSQCSRGLCAPCYNSQGSTCR